MPQHRRQHGSIGEGLPKSTRIQARIRQEPPKSLALLSRHPRQGVVAPFTTDATGAIDETATDHDAAPLALSAKLDPNSSPGSVQAIRRVRRAGGRRMTYQESVRNFEKRPPRIGGARKTVLIVEDNELNMKLFNDLLAAHGYATLQARSGTEALTIAREHTPNLILMDIQLPEVSGLEVTKWLKEDDRLPLP